MTLERGQSGGVAQKLQSYAVRGSDQLSRALHQFCVCVGFVLALSSVRSHRKCLFLSSIHIAYSMVFCSPCLSSSASLYLSLHPPTLQFHPLFSSSLPLVSLGPCSGVVPLSDRTPTAVLFSRFSPPIFVVKKL